MAGWQNFFAEHCNNKYVPVVPGCREVWAQGCRCLRCDGPICPCGALWFHWFGVCPQCIHEAYGGNGFRA